MSTPRTLLLCVIVFMSDFVVAGDRVSDETAGFEGETVASVHQRFSGAVTDNDEPIRLRPGYIRPQRELQSKPSDDAKSPPSSLPPAQSLTYSPSSSSSRTRAVAAIEQTVDMLAPSTTVVQRGVADAPDEDAPPVPQVSVALKRPELNPMATRIVSVGRTVAFKLRPTVDDGRVAAIHVDRLPGNARFEQNADGSATFYWPTAHQDQGEHVFRFSAKHPDDPALISHAEAVIIVGDPSLGGSSPRSPAPALSTAADQPDAATAVISGQDDSDANEPASASDPFAADFDPSMDPDLAPEFDEADAGEWDLEDPELEDSMSDRPDLEGID